MTAPLAVTEHAATIHGAPPADMPLLDVAELEKRFPVSGTIGPLGRLRRRMKGGPVHLPHVHAVDDVSFVIRKGETVGLVGESGCGKSTLVRVLTRLLDPSGGIVRLGGRELSLTPARRFAKDPDRGRIQMVFQDAGESINPRFTAFAAIADPLRRLRGLKGAALTAKVERAADQCGLPRALLTRFPHQLSGGQRARVGIARAVAVEPDLLVLDEPTAALDVSVQVVILQLLDTLKTDLGMSYLFVSHDLGVVRLICDRVLVMYLGKIVESGPARDVFANPLHPYTRALVDAAPSLHDRGAGRIRLQGEPRSPIDPDPNVCRFYGRCPKGTDRCTTAMPELRRFGDREVACHFAEEITSR
ncbi:peptide ABC transporter ATP-binding protein [Rhodoplanes elegans]|uniref:Peptide ABC transporter ATP-binding protein n=1 Tax=Rhodoplanes elegans TaxID=29408 RepID=A0A327K9B0_9BRAD|nr:ABC transporter ATP-binding protein [Rhodoplanes elegans]MBK5961719.1 peptide ABC transporter ATP-binding protein [Rhodoplanes elegans]RAI34546.1 peptide ABC transporter ATP-binding protein [Rhodoplanes elegans]